MIFSISRSSTSLSCAVVISPLSRLARASFSGAVRKIEPTTSARNGGLVLGIGQSSKEFIVRHPSGQRAFRQLKSEWRLMGEVPTALSSSAQADDPVFPGAADKLPSCG